MASKELINNFLASKKMVVAGVSRNEKKFGKAIYDHLLKNDFDITPINPNTTEINGKQCYPDIKSIPENFENLYIVTPKSQTKEIVEQALEKGVKRIWIQQMSETKEVIKLIEDAGVELIAKKCMFMFVEPVESIHKFHKFFKNLFGSLYN